MQVEAQASSLEPKDWDEYRELCHQMVDDVLTHLQSLDQKPTWQQMPLDLEERIRGEPLPRKPAGEKAAYGDFTRDILHFPSGNLHPRFFGWVEGSGLPFASMADMLASSLNPHMAGFNHAPKLVEQKLVDWMAELMGFPSGTSGVLESGGTMSNILALAVARYAKCGFDVREQGVQAGSQPLTVYCSDETHGWIEKGMEFLGLGRRFLRKVPVDDQYRMKIDGLRDMIEADRAAGLRPICVIGTAGTVNTGACDDLVSLSHLCKDEDIWFHVDGAFGAFLKLSPANSHLVEGVELADSLAIDLHKWMFLPFEIACVLVRDEAAHTGTFALAPSYIAELDRGVIAGGLPFWDRGMDLSRSFKALKAWMCLKAYGVEGFTKAIERNLGQTRLLVELVNASPDLQLMSPSTMNIACFRFVRPGLDGPALDALNLETLLRLQESGDAVVSSTVLDGKFALRFCTVNHRTQVSDIQMLVDSVVKHGRKSYLEMPQTARNQG